MLTEAQVREFHENGFLKAGRVYDDDRVEALCQRLDAVMEGRTEAKPECVRNLLGQSEQVVVQIINIWEADDLFRAHPYHPQICAMAAQLMSADVVRVWHDQIQYKLPRVGGPTDWHQDHPYWPIIEPADLVSAWLALDDATLENGCMRMVPRSHRWGPHKGGTIGTDPDGFTPTPDMSLVPPEEKIEIVPCEVRRGEVMFHHCLTWHGSAPNRSGKPRRAIAVHYMPGWTRYVPKRGHLVEHHVEVAPGEILQGRHFPTVWDHGPVKPAGY
ncbi:MAG: phytanoyl-CoA dioxygenase family protein [Armatimonadetes bacterium]|nr:phytanoyl-CoA dioxygenase family protein [Armatimonadota bacterium]